jgi:hypothetical protein
MRDDRVIAAFERGMRRPLALAATAFFITMGVFVAGITLIIDSTTRGDVSFPAVVTIAVPPTAKNSVTVSYSGGVVAGTTHISLSRGGAATRTSTSPSSSG